MREARSFSYEMEEYNSISYPKSSSWLWNYSYFKTYPKLSITPGLNEPEGSSSGRWEYLENADAEERSNQKG